MYMQDLPKERHLKFAQKYTHQNLNLNEELVQREQCEKSNFLNAKISNTCPKKTFNSQDGRTKSAMYPVIVIKLLAPLSDYYNYYHN